MAWLGRCGLAALAALATLHAQPAPGLVERIRALSRDSEWRQTAAIRLKFRAFHPQGLVKTADRFFLSSVEVRNRTAGEGIGHLFVMDLEGNLIADLKLGEGAIYHPGGIDYDGTHIWVPVAEYRPDSRSIVYRVDPRTLHAVEVFRFADHLGAIVHDTDAGTLHGVSWGSRRFYSWATGGGGAVSNTGERAPASRIVNPSHYVDYQDCKYAGSRLMLCTGVTEVQPQHSTPFRLGGIELVSLEDGRPVHQVPVTMRLKSGPVLTQNPSWFEPAGTGMRGYFAPEDDSTVIYMYEVR